MDKKKIVILGLGLIGGSIAKALKESTEHTLLGMDTNEDSLLDACSCGAVDDKASQNDLYTADIIFICVYPDAAISFIKQHGAKLKEGCIVTDTCGIKKEICTVFEENSKCNKYDFVAGHPMAGKEFSGFEHSSPSIFSGASYIIAPGSAPKGAIETVKHLALKMGFGKVIMTTPEKHDKMIAFTSQLPHAIACAYVKSPRCLEHKGFSAGSYRDVSRVADINYELWGNLFLENKEDLVEEIDEFIKNMTEIRNAIDTGNESKLKSLLKQSSEIKKKDKAQ